MERDHRDSDWKLRQDVRPLSQERSGPRTVPHTQRVLRMCLVTESGHTELSSESRSPASALPRPWALRQPQRDTSHWLPLPIPEGQEQRVSHTARQARAGAQRQAWGEGPGAVVWTQSRQAFMSQPDSCPEHHLSPQQHILGASLPPSLLPWRAAAAARLSESDRAHTLPSLPSPCAKSHFLLLNCFLLRVSPPPPVGP